MSTRQHVVGDEKHEHDHAPLVHGHRYVDEEDEKNDHDATAHIRDHDSPTGGGS